MSADPKPAVSDEQFESIMEGIATLGRENAARDASHRTEVEELRAKNAELDKKIVEQAKSSKKSLDDAVDIIADKLGRMERRQIATGKLSLVDVTDVLVAAIPEKKRWLVRFCEATMPANEKGRFKDAPFKAATELWFQNATFSQLKKYQGDAPGMMAEKSVIEKAFADAYRYDVEQKATLIEGTDAMGGYLVPDPVAAEINRLIEDNSVMRPLVRKVPMTSKTLDLPKRGSGAITAYIVAENAATGDAMPASNAFAALTLTAKKFAGRATASIEAIQDSPVGLLDYIRTSIAEEIGILEDFEALEGTTNFTGVAADAAVNEITAASGGDALTYAKLVAVVFKARQRASRIGAQWFMAPEAMAKVVGLRADAVTAGDGAGLPIFQFAQVPNAIPYTLLGFPIQVISSIKIDRTNGAGTNLTNIYFGPPDAIVFGDRAGMAWDVSEAPNWSNFLVDMRLMKRTAIGVAVPKAMTRALDLKTA